MIARIGVGTDSIDIDVATRRGVAVCTTPGANASSTADHAVALMLAALRRVPEHDSGGPRRRAGIARAMRRRGSSTGATVGLVGFGAIGRLVARRLVGFGVRRARAATRSPRRTPGVESSSSTSCSARATSCRCTLPLTGATRAPDRPPPARADAAATRCSSTPRAAALVDEDALSTRSRRGRLRAAALDVFEREPPAARGCSSCRTSSSPRTSAGVSERSVAEMTRRATDAVLDVLAGRVPARRGVNPEALAGE